MKVLLIHNFYQSSSPSGEDVVYRNEAEMLRDKGIEVIQYEKHNDDISGAFKKIKSAFSMAWSKETYGELRELIKKEKPDIAHFHNIWYLISPSAYYACKDAGVPVVQTLHNFRMFCANGLLLRDGKICESCIGKTPWRSVAHSCFRNSMIYSFPVAMAEAIHKAKKTWSQNIDAYIALTEFGKQKFIQCGIPEEKLFVKPNFIPDPPGFSSSSQDYAVFIGRLSAEKGIEVLIDALRNFKNAKLQNTRAFSFKVIGEGPLTAELKAKGVDIEFAGRKSNQECMEILKKAMFLVMPAVCYENFPLTIIEAFACGKPVIASRLGAMAAIVEDKKTGLLFEPGNPEELASKINWMIENKDACMEMGRNARSVFEEKYASDKNIKILLGIYQKAIQGRK